MISILVRLESFAKETKSMHYMYIQFSDQYLCISEC